MRSGTRAPRPPFKVRAPELPSLPCFLPHLLISNNPWFLFILRDILIVSLVWFGVHKTGYSDGDESDLSSDGLVGDSASEGSGAGSDDDGSADEAELEKHEDSYVKQQVTKVDPAEYSDPEYGYNSEDSENEV